MSRRRDRQTGRREAGRFALLPHAVLDSANFIALSAPAVRLLLDFARQYNGHSNNGDLAAPWSQMQRRGWRSRDTLARALAELQHFGMIERCAQGGMHRPNLYAISWAAIDPCKGKLDVAATTVPSGKWRQSVGPFEMATRKRDAQHADRVASTRQTCRREPRDISTEPNQHADRVVRAFKCRRIDTADVSLSRSNHVAQPQAGES